MSKLDRNACMILNLLQEDCRMSLTEISKRIGLSVDSVRKRINKMKAEGIYYPRIQLRPRQFGFPNIIDVRIKLRDYTKDDLAEFVSYLRKDERVVEVFSLSGEWDFAIVLLSEDPNDLIRMSSKIRDRFGKIINTWSASLTTRVWKFETYDVLKLMRFEQQDDA